MSVFTHYRVVSGTLVIQFQPPQRVLSSAVLGGGFCDAMFILNHWLSKRIPLDHNGLRADCHARAMTYLQRLIRQFGLEGAGVGLMTAVNVTKRLVVLQRGFRGLWVEGFITVGVANLVRAGDPATAMDEEEKAHRVGTINMILITNASLSDPAMIEAIQVATEAKAAILLESGMKSRVSSKPATGTGTDCTAIVSGHGRPIRYCGTHTKMGELIGRVVADGILEGLHKSQPMPSSNRTLSKEV